MEVGIEDCLHIEFEYNKSKYVISTVSSDWPPFGEFVMKWVVNDLSNVLMSIADAT